VQSAVRAVLESLSREGGVYTEGASIGTRHAERREGRLLMGYEAGRIENNIVDVVFQRLGRIDLNRLGQCKRCQTVFLGQRGQIYCGKPCATASASEAYRNRKRATINQKAKTQYEKKQRAQLGPRVRVGRKKKEGQ